MVASLVTVMVYVFVVAPSCAVTMVVMVLEPTDKGMLADGDPDAVGAPLTVTRAVGSPVVGVTVIDVVALPNEAE